MTKRVGITGASGRLGSVALRLLQETQGFEAVELDSYETLELDGVDVVFDATVLGASVRIVAQCVAAGVPVVVATSGWNTERIEQLREAGATGVRVVPNFSVGSVLATHLATIAARHFEIAEIIETHHAGKADAPSGTATRTAEAIARVRHQVSATPEEQGRGALVQGIPVHALRIPGVLARQEVVFGGTGETLSIRHDTLSADSYALGIVLALRDEAPAGVAVGLDDLLGLAQ